MAAAMAVTTAIRRRRRPPADTRVPCRPPPVPSPPRLRRPRPAPARLRRQVALPADTARAAADTGKRSPEVGQTIGLRRLSAFLRWPGCERTKLVGQTLPPANRSSSDPELAGENACPTSSPGTFPTKDDGYLKALRPPCVAAGSGGRRVHRSTRRPPPAGWGGSPYRSRGRGGHAPAVPCGTVRRKSLGR